MSLISACNPNNTALILESGRHVSHADLEREVVALRTVFPQRGVVFCLCNNDFPSVCCYLAALDETAVPLLLPGTIHKAQLQSLIAAYAPRYLFHNRTDLNDYGPVLWAGNGYHLFACSTESYPIHPDLALLLATSGSTGSPKLVRLSQRNLESNAQAIIDYLGITASDRAITSLPMHYSYGLSVINSHLRAGASIVLSDRSLMDAEYWRLIQRHEVTSLSGVPYSYEMLLKLRIERLNMPAVKTMTQAGGKLADSKIKLVTEACVKKGIRFFVMYGQTEATARISYLPPERAIEKAGSIGIAIPGGELWIEDDGGQRIEQPGITGQLVYRGPNVSFGHANSYHDLNLGDINQGVLKTGDLASFDEDHFFTIAGRLNRFVKIYGIRISLDTVEDILAARKIESVVYGDDDQLIVCLVGNQNIALDEIRIELANILAINRVAILVRPIESIPRLCNGKVDYQALTK